MIQSEFKLTNSIFNWTLHYDTVITVLFLFNLVENKHFMKIR